MLKAKVEDCLIYLVNIYAPNTETAQCQLYNKLGNEMCNFGIETNCNIILCGDFNVPIN